MLEKHLTVIFFEQINSSYSSEFAFVIAYYRNAIFDYDG